MEWHYDIVIIGAGLAGLTLARQLAIQRAGGADSESEHPG